MALTCDMRMCDRRNSSFILTSASWPSCDVEASISVSGRVMPAMLPPQIGSRAQNRACGALAPRAAQEASEGRKRHEIERSRRSPEAPGAAEARGRRPVDVLDRSRCRTEVLRTFDFRRLTSAQEFEGCSRRRKSKVLRTSLRHRDRSSTSTGGSERALAASGAAGLRRERCIPCFWVPPERLSGSKMRRAKGS